MGVCVYIQVTGLKVQAVRRANANLLPPPSQVYSHPSLLSPLAVYEPLLLLCCLLWRRKLLKNTNSPSKAAEIDAYF